MYCACVCGLVGRWVIGPESIFESVFACVYVCVCVCALFDLFKLHSVWFMTDRIYKSIVRLELDI